MPKLSDLGLTNERVGDVDFATMPDQRGSFGPLPQPGTYRFKTPQFNGDSPIFDTFDTTKGKRLNLKFEDSYALTIVQSPGNAHNGETLHFRLSNAEFNRAKKGEPEILASDMDYILRDVGGVQKRPATNQQYAQALVQAFSNVEFTADLEFQWRCNDKTDIRVDDGQGGSQVLEGQKGCGSKYYQAYTGSARGVQKVLSNPEDPNSPQVYPERIECSGKDGVPCGAIVRAFPQLRNFRK